MEPAEEPPEPKPSDDVEVPPPGPAGPGAGSVPPDRAGERSRYDVMRSSIVDSIRRSRVVRDLSPKRVYAGNRESHAELPALFRQTKALEYLRPLRPRSPGDQGRESRQPRLLQRLEYLLQEKLRLADSIASPYDDPGGAAQQGMSSMRLDAYRQAFEAFIHSFTTYRPLLLRIKAQYDAALEDALQSSQEHVHMKAELAVVEQRRIRTVEEARTSAAQQVSEARKELEHRLLAMEERAAAAEARVRAAESEARAARAEEEIALGEKNDYKEMVNQLRREMIDSSTWAQHLAKFDTDGAADASSDDKKDTNT
uniref:Flagellar associated protein n=2 Tax=Tetraselmis sp. GSL018 TaxID=582737 RepID=A0A061S9K7_9CHLO|mmetsp:Transcript_25423/g.60458  ORF Transcript_25423/g.60458 Transcript_25423/m.60458 type:complete len:312 (-) Transcript_25423:377-1312(-)|eukprot:CAMPEP_0177589716 /NCGR_PEP_ID=MMETSP0419_2-20121207/6973_1 /TAXON_ID=582737 /ORGANISM="Tetraselmis sp., Strain GSL018" /LENGTH=311 /DNA_ID=CAMNT_0019080131 /DNA_START=180 /DNA_END=1115 /DNA_ORIENTATION=-